MANTPNEYELNMSAEFLQKVDPTLRNVALNKSKHFAAFKAKCKMEKVSPAGLATIQRYKANANLQMGASSMDYPTPTVLRSGRYSMRTANLVVTHAFDHETYDALLTKGNARSSEQGGAVSNLGNELKALAGVFADRQAFFLGGDGSGAVAKIITGSTDTSLVCQTTADGTHAGTFGASQIDTEVDYDVYRAGTGVIGTFNIPFDSQSLINRSTNTVSLVGLTALSPGTVAAGDLIVHSGSAYEAPNGFAYLIDGGKTGTWQGRYVTSSSEDQSSSLDLSSKAVTPGYLEQALMKRQLREKSSSRDAITWYTSPAQQQEFSAGFYGIVRLSGFQKSVDSRQQADRYGSKMIEEYPYLDGDRWYGIEEAKIIYAEQIAPGTYAPGGNIFTQLRGTAGYGKGVLATNFGSMYNFLNPEPGAHIVIKNAGLTSGVSTLANYLV